VQVGGEAREHDPDDAAPAPAGPAPGSVLARWLRLRAWLSEDFLGGPKRVRMSWVINLQKGGTLPFVVALMAAFGEWSTTACVYAGLHGGYGLVWLLKERVFPDAAWQKKITAGAAVNVFLLVLGPYWLAPVLIVARHHHAAPATTGAAVLLFALGVVAMVGSDAQKYFVLRVRPGLVTDGFFARVRHPNYLGEMMVYASFALLAGHWAPWLVLAWVWLAVFLPNILQKEARLARHPGWAAYAARTRRLLPLPRPRPR
jgi:protein-S-isoprenylcysteine O-methyltransferase Ste14